MRLRGQGWLSLHMSFADLDEALEAAKKAVALDPNLSQDPNSAGFRLSDAGRYERGQGCL